jgi:alpha,alpha-trehalase
MKQILCDGESVPQIRGDLFEAVQRNRVFDDSKTFVDSVPTSSPETILRRFRDRRGEPDFDLRTFVERQFALPDDGVDDAVETGARTMRAHVDEMWDHLTCEPVDPDDGESLISLPHPYVVPGGRFRETYYWDSYFAAEGLAASGRLDVVEGMARNFASLVDRLGFVSNGNRCYYTTRSQFPLFCRLVNILVRERGIDAAAPYLHSLECEREFWMRGRSDLTEPSSSVRRTVLVDDGAVLNRYWDGQARPRPESYHEDVSLAESVPPDRRERLYRDVRAACESGWDFSSRWLADGESLSTIRTTELVPVDLNAALYDLESTLAEWSGHHGDAEAAESYRDAARQRAVAVDARCWDDDAGFYFDYCWSEGERTDVWSLAGVTPLFFELASDRQAAAVGKNLRDRFLAEGGLPTTLRKTGKQWDRPNGWAPLHWFAVVGLRRYGHDDLAREIARRWLRLNASVFARTGKMMEKYNVANAELRTAVGEYPLQDGFGWTNGVVVVLAELFDRPLLETALD